MNVINEGLVDFNEWVQRIIFKIALNAVVFISVFAEDAIVLNCTVLTLDFALFNSCNNITYYTRASKLNLSIYLIVNNNSVIIFTLEQYSSRN